MKITTASAVRASFWSQHPQFAPMRDIRKTQNDYPAEIRCAWCDYIDQMHKSGLVSDELAWEVSL